MEPTEQVRAMEGAAAVPNGGASIGERQTEVEVKTEASSAGSAGMSVEAPGLGSSSAPSLAPLAFPTEALIPAINYDAVPSLRGILIRGGNLLAGGGGKGAAIVVKGLWAMLDSHHSTASLTSDFELQLTEPTTIDNNPRLDTEVSGKYKGWFKLKRTSGSGADKVEERNLVLSFEEATNEAEGTYEITGEGSNKFGNYYLKGKVSPDQQVIMYRQYVVKIGESPLVSPKASKKKSGSAIKPTGLKTAVTPREGSGRERKKSSVLADAYIAPEPKAKGEAQSNRAQRQPAALLKCGDLLKELMRLPPGFFFLEPVDPIQLNIPEYLNVITTPMDFGTVRRKLEGQEYVAASNFAADVRLIFRNAITFNQLKDNPVHIAARELSTKFEEKFAQLHANMNSHSAVSAADIAAFNAKGNKGGQKSKSRGGGSRKSIGGGQRQQQFAYGGPQALPPDGSMLQMQEMHRKMMEMQSEIVQLRTSVSQDTVRNNLTQQQLAAQNPLTYQEKKTLIENIHKLEPDHMETVVQIIQNAAPASANGNDEEIEIPLDELDTSTLRKLQGFVGSIHAKDKKKRPAAAVSQSKPVAKKAKGDEFGDYDNGAPFQQFAPAPAPVDVMTSYALPPAAPENKASGMVGDTEYENILAGSSDQMGAFGDLPIMNADAWTKGSSA